MIDSIQYTAKCKAQQAEAAEEVSLDVRADVPEKKSDTPKSKKRKESTNVDGMQSKQTFCTIRRCVLNAPIFIT